MTPWEADDVLDAVLEYGEARHRAVLGEQPGGRGLDADVDTGVERGLEEGTHQGGAGHPGGLLLESGKGPERHGVLGHAGGELGADVLRGLAEPSAL